MMPIYGLGDFVPDVPSQDRWWMAPDALIIGKVRVGAGVGIWFGSVLRGDNEWITIGKDSNVQEASILHTDVGHPLTVGSGCTIGHRAILHGCVVGDDSLVGMGATILNGAEIGRNSMVGANALVTEGKKFPDNSLIVGAPARVVREISPEQRAAISSSANSYVHRWKQFAAELRSL